MDLPTARNGYDRSGSGGETADPGLLTVAEVADRLQVSRMKVYRLVHEGLIPALRVGRSFRIRRADLAEFRDIGCARADADDLWDPPERLGT